MVLFMLLYVPALSLCCLHVCDCSVLCTAGHCVSMKQELLLDAAYWIGVPISQDTFAHNFAQCDYSSVFAVGH